MPTMLGIDVDDTQLARLARLAVPAAQPFWGPPDLLAATGTSLADGEPPRLLRDTYGMYGDAARAPHVVLDEVVFLALDRPVRAALVRAQVDRGRELVPTVRAWPHIAGGRTQADGRRFVWWPSLAAGHEDAVVRSVVEDGSPASRHREVPDDVWAACADVLPGARDLAGTFAAGTDANCFATVLCAAGAPGCSDGDSAAQAEPVAEQWVQRGAVEAFVADRTRPARVRCDDEPGTVLLWRSTDGAPQHAAVTLGGGWALSKANQCWWTPRVVLTVADTIRSARTPGLRLARHRLR